jgi:ABC-type proline/glycine betaine transport system ATPase subunit
VVGKNCKENQIVINKTSGKLFPRDSAARHMKRRKIRKQIGYPIKQTELRLNE